MGIFDKVKFVMAMVSKPRITCQNPSAECVVRGEGQEGTAVEHALDLGVVVTEALVVEGVLLPVVVKQDHLALCLLHVVFGTPEISMKSQQM